MGFKNFEIFKPPSRTLLHLPILTHPCLLSSLALLSVPVRLSTLPLMKNPSLYTLRLSVPDRLSKTEFRLSNTGNLHVRHQGVCLSLKASFHAFSDFVLPSFHCPDLMPLLLVRWQPPACEFTICSKHFPGMKSLTALGTAIDAIPCRNQILLITPVVHGCSLI